MVGGMERKGFQHVHPLQRGGGLTGSSTIKLVWWEIPFLIYKQKVCAVSCACWSTNTFHTNFKFEGIVRWRCNSLPPETSEQIEFWFCNWTTKICLETRCCWIDLGNFDDSVFPDWGEDYWEPGEWWAHPFSCNKGSRWCLNNGDSYQSSVGRASLKQCLSLTNDPLWNTVREVEIIGWLCSANSLRNDAIIIYSIRLRMRNIRKYWLKSYAPVGPVCRIYWV